MTAFCMCGEVLLKKPLSSSFFIVQAMESGLSPQDKGQQRKIRVEKSTQEHCGKGRACSLKRALFMLPSVVLPGKPFPFSFCDNLLPLLDTSSTDLCLASRTAWTLRRPFLSLSSFLCFLF